MYVMSVLFVIYLLSLALLRRGTVNNHMGNFQMAVEDLRVVLREEPQNAAATVGDSSLTHGEHMPAAGWSTRCPCICVRPGS